MATYYVQPGVATENGWPMVNADQTVSVEVVPAAKAVPLLKGSVATILNAFLILYNKEVDTIKSQVWGWSPYNDVWNSNHMSATAVDIGAPLYPWGSRTMPAATIAKVRTLLAKFDGVVYWGADWNYPDEMHFQIGVPPTSPKVAALAEKLNNGYLNVWPTEETEQDIDMSLTESQDARLNEIVENTRATRVATEEILRQLGQPGGWPQGGGRTLYDLTAAVAEVEGVPNTRDTLG